MLMEDLGGSVYDAFIDDKSGRDSCDQKDYRKG